MAARDRRSLDDVVTDTRTAVETLGAATAHEVTRERIDDLDGREYTVFETVGALARLEDRGVLTSEGTDAGRRYRLAEEN